MKLFELLDDINKIVPLKYAFEDDSVGITIGENESKVTNIVVGHELDDYLLDYCSNNNIDTVITYHPPPYKKITAEDNSENFLPESITTNFIGASINVITIHTAQDVCKDGNADTLVDLFNMKNSSVFAKTIGEFGAGRIGNIDKKSSKELKKVIENKLVNYTFFRKTSFPLDSCIHPCFKYIFYMFLRRFLAITENIQVNRLSYVLRYYQVKICFRCIF